MTTTTSLYETCQNLFDKYPLAVNGHGSMALMLTGRSDPAFYGLARATAGFDIWNWDGPSFARITPGSEPPATGEVAEILTSAVPLPRNGAFLAWKTGGVTTTLITVHTEWTPEYPLPSWETLALDGTRGSSWAPFTGEKLLGPWFWDYWRNGDIVDLAALVAATPDTFFWAAPEGVTWSCVAVTRDVTSPDGWTFPRGAYVFTDLLLAGETAGPLDGLLAGDLTDLSRRFRKAV